MFNYTNGPFLLKVLFMNACQSTDLLTSSVAVFAGPSYLNGLVVQGDGTNVATIIIYDNASAGSGKILAKVVVPASLDRTVSVMPIRGIKASLGLYVSISGTGAAVNMYYGAAG